jgi:hypothetical protein
MSHLCRRFFLFIPLLCCLLFSYGCVAPNPSKNPPAYSGPAKQVTLSSDYEFRTGLARIKNLLPAGRYNAVFEDQTGTFYQHERLNPGTLFGALLNMTDSAHGIFVSADRTTAYLWITTRSSTAEERRNAEQVMGPGTVLVGNLIFPEAKPGAIIKALKITGEPFSAFVFSP